MGSAPGGFYPAQQAPVPYADLTDNEVIELARQVHARFQVVARRDPENDDLIRQWGNVLREMERRGITDTVTEAGPVNAAGPGCMTADTADGE
jgi:hypothetical protein